MLIAKILRLLNSVSILQALEPVIHRDFHQSMKLIDPVRPYTPMSTPASRETRSRLQSSRNKVFMHCNIIIVAVILNTYVYYRERISYIWLRVQLFVQR